VNADAIHILLRITTLNSWGRISKTWEGVRGILWDVEISLLTEDRQAVISRTLQDLLLLLYLLNPLTANFAPPP